MMRNRSPKTARESEIVKFITDGIWRRYTGKSRQRVRQDLGHLPLLGFAILVLWLPRLKPDR